jgi:hypothetical protein
MCCFNQEPSINLINVATWPPNRQFDKTFWCLRLTKTFIVIPQRKEPHPFLYTILGWAFGRTKKPDHQVKLFLIFIPFLMRRLPVTGNTLRIAPRIATFLVRTMGMSLKSIKGGKTLLTSPVGFAVWLPAAKRTPYSPLLFLSTFIRFGMRRNNFAVLNGANKRQA